MFRVPEQGAPPVAEELPISAEVASREQLQSQLSSVEVLLNMTEQHFRHSKTAIDRVREEYLSLEQAFTHSTQLAELERLEPRFKIIRARLELLNHGTNNTALQ
jgi:hypothetical protein